MPEAPVQILSYHPRQRWSRRRLAGIIAAITLAAILFIPSTNLTSKQVTIRIDSVTGSMTTETSYFHGHSSAIQVAPSPLELRLIRMNHPWTPNWQFLSERSVDLFGARRIACGWAPPIYEIRSVLQRFVDASTDDEIRAFIQVTQTGTPHQQRTAIDAAGDKALSHMASRPGATHD